MKVLAAFLAGCVSCLGAVTYCQPLVIQHSKVPSDQSDYVLTVNDLDPHLATVANGGYVVSSSGEDIVFSSDSSGVNLLKWDPLEVYDPVTGLVVTHVAVGTVSHTSDTIVYRCAGHTTGSFMGGTTGAVWPAGYSGVYHLGGGATLSAADSTSRANNGTIAGPSATPGKIGGAAYVVSPGDQVTIPQSLSFPLSVEAWINVNALTNTQGILTVPGAYNSIHLYLDSTGSLRVNFGGDCAVSPHGAITSGAWFHVAATFVSGGSACTGYVNGAQVASGTLLGQSQGAISPAILGNFSTTLPLAGALDEVRVYSGILLPDRLQTDYNNESNPTAFYIPGAWAPAFATQGSMSQVSIY